MKNNQAIDLIYFDLYECFRDIKTAMNTLSKVSIWLEDMQTANTRDDYTKEGVDSIFLMIDLVNHNLEKSNKITEKVIELISENAGEECSK